MSQLIILRSVRENEAHKQENRRTSEGEFVPVWVNENGDEDEDKDEDHKPGWMLRGDKKRPIERLPIHSRYAAARLGRRGLATATTARHR